MISATDNAHSLTGLSLDTCLCLHAEENALLECGRERLSTDDCTIYCNTCPCLLCSIKIIQCGITEVVYAQGYAMDLQAAELFKKANVTLRVHTLPPQAQAGFLA